MIVPILAGGVIAGSLGYVIWDKYFAKKVAAPSGGQVTPTPKPPNAPSAADNIRTGSAAPKAAMLHDFLKKNGTNPNPVMQGMVQDFQKAANADINKYTDDLGHKLMGILPTTGVYDTPTSAALTLYTHDPIAPSPSAPKPAVPTGKAATDFTTPGNAATSGYNLYMYLKGHANDKLDANLKQLVNQFQTDVNTDPKYPGPAGKTPPILIKSALVVTGYYDNPTADALAVVSADRIAP